MGGSSKIPFETHLENLQEPAKTIMVDLRKFALSLGGNVIEEVRPHRVVYAKTLNFRTFLDIEPAGDSLIVSTKAGRGGPAAAVKVRTAQDADAAKKQIAEAYQKVQ